MFNRFWTAIERVSLLLGLWLAITSAVGIGVVGGTVVTTVVVESVFDVDLELLERAALKYLEGE